MPEVAEEVVAGQGPPAAGQDQGQTEFPKTDAKFIALGLTPEGQPLDPERPAEAADGGQDDEPAKKDENVEAVPDKPEPEKVEGELSARDKHILKFFNATPEELAAEPEARQRELDRYRGLYLKANEQLGRLGAQLQKAGAGKPAAEDPSKKPDAPVSVGADGELPDFTEEDLDDDTALMGKLNKFAATVKAVQAENAALKAERAQGASGQGQDDTKQDTAVIDAFFKGLDAKAFAVFGTGPLSALPKDSDAYKARAKVIAQTQLIAAGHEALHGEAPDLGILLEDALQQTHGDIIRSVQEAARKAKGAERRSQAYGRPGARARSQFNKGTGVERSNHAIDAWEKRTGIAVPP